MARNQRYFCTKCGEITPKADLTVKRILFQTMGQGASQIRSRVSSWLCKDCLELDSDYNRKPHQLPTRTIHD